jgi:two-component system, chemotaxis family, sensor kinase CheA
MKITFKAEKMKRLKLSILKRRAMDDFEQELKISFLDEALQSASEVENCFLELEHNPNDDENINRIFRHVHNLKGSARAVGFEEFAAFTHQFENFILKVKSKEINPNSTVVSILLKGNDQIILMINGLKSDMSARFGFSELIEEMKNYNESKASEEIIEALAEKFSNPTDALSSLSPEEFLEIHEREEYEKTSVAAALQNAPDIVLHKAPAAVPTVAQNKSTGEETLRVGLSKIEMLINSIGEMVILQGVLRETVNDSENLLLKKTVHQLRKVGKEIQDISMSLRMVAIKPTFQKMQRIVRDTSQALNKEIHLELIGEETEIDKTVLEKINDPLVHLIRNAVDHGIEPIEKRIAANKSKQGSIKLSAMNLAGKMIVEIKDDGGGMDPERLKKKAIEKGLIKHDNNLSDKDAFKLIFAPGFSTAEKVTDVSGRGVGMDVVRTNISELGGDIQIDSIIGKGTTFKIVLPLTLAIVEAMVVTYSGNKFVLPLSQMLESLSPSKEMIQNNMDLGETLMLRGENLPMIRIGDFFGIKSSIRSEKMIAMVVSVGQSSVALLVDDILGQFEVVVKKLSPELEGIKGVSGTTILGDGKPALIIDPIELVKRKTISGFTLSKNENLKTESNKENQKMGSAA